MLKIILHISGRIELKDKWKIYTDSSFYQMDVMISF